MVLQFLALAFIGTVGATVASQFTARPTPPPQDNFTAQIIGEQIRAARQERERAKEATTVPTGVQKRTPRKVTL